jgi:hypothetical protein
MEGGAVWHNLKAKILYFVWYVKEYLNKSNLHILTNLSPSFSFAASSLHKKTQKIACGCPGCQKIYLLDGRRRQTSQYMSLSKFHIFRGKYRWHWSTSNAWRYNCVTLALDSCVRNSSFSSIVFFVLITVWKSQVTCIKLTGI